MDNFLQAFAEGLDEESQSNSPDESPANRVNVVLRSARRYIASPDREKAYFEKELEAFATGIEQALSSLETLSEEAGDAEQAVIEAAHADLDFLAQHVDDLENLLEDPNEQLLNRIVQELLVPTYRLLIAQQALENLGSTISCPYCEAENTREAAKCEGCGKPLTVPDPLKQEGELIAVPPTISQLLQLCFNVAREPEEHLDTWQNHLINLRHQFGEAHKRVQQALQSEEPSSLKFQEFGEMDRGLEVMLAGFDELESFAESKDAEILDTGWVNMMSGFKIFKQAGDRLAVGAAV